MNDEDMPPPQEDTPPVKSPLVVDPPVPAEPVPSGMAIGEELVGAD